MGYNKTFMMMTTFTFGTKILNVTFTCNRVFPVLLILPPLDTMLEEAEVAEEETVWNLLQF